MEHTRIKKPLVKTSQYKGVCWDSTHKKWIAKIVLNGKAKYLGYFDDEEIAYNAWLDYRDKYRPRQTVADLEGEEWRPVKKFGGNYYVSNKGRVKNTDFKRQGDEILLKPFEDAHGYYEVKKGSIHGKVHRLVLAAFVGESKLPANHKDFNPKNNCLENLEYVTQRENVTHSVLRNRKHFGCTWDTYWNKWVSHIRIKGKSIYLGRFDNKSDAFASYINAVRERGLDNKYAEEAYLNSTNF